MRRSLILTSLGLCSSAAFAAEVGYWSFDEGVGTAIADASGSGNAGSLVNGGNAWVAGKSGTALYFGGMTGAGSTRVEIPDSPSLRLSSAASFAAWIRSEDIFRDAPVLAKEGSGILSYWFGTFGPSGAGHWGILLSSTGGAWQFNGRDRGNAPGTEWVHIATTWDGTTASFYVNGALEGTLGWTGAVFQGPAKVSIGTNSDYNFTAFKGSIDEVHLYDSSITAQEVQALAAVPEPTTLAALGLGILLMSRRRARRR